MLTDYPCGHDSILKHMDEDHNRVDQLISNHAVYKTTGLVVKRTKYHILLSILLFLIVRFNRLMAADGSMLRVFASFVSGS